jgi:Fe-S cluster biogenesis protein NfuA
MSASYIYLPLHFIKCIDSSGEGWEHVENVGITKDLADVLNSDETIKQYNTAYVRALSFTYPQKSTMEDFAEGWRMKVQEAQQQRMKMMSNDDDLVGGGTIATIQRETQQQQMNVITVGDEYEFDEDDEDMDEDELDDYLQMMAESRAAVSSSIDAAAPLFVDATSSSSIDSAAATAASDDDSNIISPFESETSSSTPASNNNIEQEGPLELNKENVDKVLDEVRPYLISDGGNVSVQNVDTSTGNVYLVLEGACGSCASSTVTMQMGIERVLKEKFEEKLGEVIQVDPNDDGDGNGGKPTELTMEAVQSEVKRISQAITAMGGVVRVVSVDKIGVVEIEFRGPNKVKKGLELALLDVEYVKHVKFVS